MRWFNKDPLSKIPIKFKLPLSFVTLYLIVFGVGGYFIINSVYDSLENEILSRLRSESLAQAAIFDKKLETLARRAEDFASDGFIRTQTEILTNPEFTLNVKKQAKNRLKNHLRNNKLPLVAEFFDLQVLDSEDHHLVSIGKPFKKVKRYFQHTNSLNRTRFSAIIPPDSFNTFASLAIVTPLWDIKRTHKIGNLLCLINLEKLINNLAQEYTNTIAGDYLEKSLTFIDPLGSHLEIPWHYFEQLANPKNHPLKLREGQLRFFTADAQKAPFLHNGRHICKNGQDMFGQSYPLRSAGWNTLIELNAKDVLKPIDVLEGNLLGVALIVAISTLLLLFFPVQFVIRPLGELQRMAFKIKEGDFSARVDIDSEDEIGNLARSFNLMAEAIEQYTTRLKQTAQDLKKREQELRIQHDRLNTVVHSMSDGLILLNNENKIVLHNKAAMPFVKLLNQQSELLVRKCDHNHLKHQNCLSCLLDTSIKTSCVLTIGDSIFEVITTQLPSIDGSAGKVLVSRDITEREKMNQRQAHQERLAVLGKTAAIVAHEMNSPLAAISMYNQMMEKELPKDSPFYEHVDVIKRNTQTCQHIIQQLLDYARTPQPKIQQIDLHQIIENVIHFLQPICRNKKIEINTHLKAQKHIILGDGTQIQQVLMNLILNAIQAAPEKQGKVKITSALSTDQNAVFIEIEDNGNGIDEKYRTEIFEPFFTTKRSGGTGLGLSTAKRIAQAHGGDIFLKQSKPGQTIFCFQIPLSLDAKIKTSESLIL